TGVGTSAFPVGQLSWDSNVAEWGIEVTDFLRQRSDAAGDLSFVLIREQRFANSSATDTDTSRIVINTRENGSGQPRLSLYMNASPAFYWNTNFDAPFSATTSWDVGASPGAAGDIAVFGDYITAPHTVNLASSITLGEIRFASLNSYTLSGAGTITLNIFGGFPSINVYQGNHTIDAPITLVNNPTINVLPGCKLTFG